MIARLQSLKILTIWNKLTLKICLAPPLKLEAVRGRQKKINATDFTDLHGFKLVVFL